MEIENDNFLVLLRIHLSKGFTFYIFLQKIFIFFLINSQDIIF